MNPPNQTDARKRPSTANLSLENAARLLVDEGFEPSMSAALEAVENEREQAWLDSVPPQSAAAYLVANGTYSTTEEALAAVYQKRGVSSPQVARVFADLAPVEKSLLKKVADAEAALAEVTAKLAEARGRPTAILNSRESHRDTVQAKRAALKVAEEKSRLLTARRDKAGENLNRKLRQGAGWEWVVDAGVVVCGIDAALSELAKMVEAAKGALVVAEKERDAFEAAHAKDLEPVAPARR